MKSFNVVEVSVGSLAGLRDISRADFMEHYRGDDHAKLWIVDIPEHDLAVSILTAPLGYALCALEYERVLMNSIMKWSRNIPKNEEQYKQYGKMLRSQGLTKKSINSMIFNWIDGPYLVGDKYKSLIEYKGSAFGQYRFSAVVTSRSNHQKVVEHYRRANAQFGDFSFVEAPEYDEDKSDYQEAYSYRFREFDPLCIFISPRHPGVGFNMRDSEQALGMSRTALIEAIGSLEAGGDLPWLPHYCNIVRPPTSMPWSLSSQANPMYEKWEFIDFELLAMRCRLIRLLGWPQMFGGLASQYDATDGLHKLATRFGTEQQRQSLLNAIKGLDLPYDPVVEVDAYFSEMISKYPILIESPF